MACSKFMAGAVGAFMLIVGLVPGAALAGGAAGTAIGAAPLLRMGGGAPELRVLHRHRTQSFYCYPKNYWWFYRPYTTGFDGHARCMPYFHYLGPDARRDSDQYIK